MEVAQLHASELRRSLEGLAELNEQREIAAEAQRNQTNHETVERRRQIKRNQHQHHEQKVKERGFY
jgi:hypothetical protein